ncbi:RNA helicase Mov10l1-like isoform X2 [Tachypleus tridentatus]|uniref:RNA helicase Mov10l1-like isoform X2 n=1 Tax=Tachypleus tridentatus TaxID=6853 RepID=UPI003FD63932
MLTLVSKAVSYLWGSPNLDDSSNDRQNNVLPNVGLGDSYDILHEQKETPVEREKISLHGKVTHIRKSDSYGLINGHIYFKFESVIGAAQPKIGNIVSISASRNKKEDSWCADSVQVLSESWDFDDTKEKCDKLITKCAAEANRDDHRILHSPGNGQYQSVLAVVTSMNGKHGILNETTKFTLQNIAVDFKPFPGDWVVADIVTCEDSETVSVLRIKPLRQNSTVGKVSSVQHDGGIVDGEIVYFYSACDIKYHPQRGDSVIVKAIESDQGRFQWRALSINPKKVSEPSLRFHTWKSPTQSSFMLELLSDKNSITISSPLDFQNIHLGTKKYITAWIRNEGSSEKVLLLCKLQTSGSSDCQFLLGIPKLYNLSQQDVASVCSVAQNNISSCLPNNALVLPPSSSAYLNITCDARSRFPLFFPQYPVPNALWEAVLQGQDVLNVAQCLVEVSLRHCREYLALYVPGLAEGQPSVLVEDQVILSLPVLEEELLYEGFVHEVKVRYYNDIPWELSPS